MRLLVKRGRFSRLGVLLALGVGAAVIWFGARQPWQTLYCAALAPLTTWSPKAEGLLKCSNVTQGLVPDRNINVVFEPQAEQPGWQVVTNVDKSRQGRFRVRVLRDRASLVFFPRVSGQTSGVEVFEVRDHQTRKLFDLRGQDSVWTPVGGRYALNLGCTLQGYLTDVHDVTLEFVLHGPWPQVWCRGEDVFF